MIKPTSTGVSAPRSYQELNDCSVRSIANVKDITYEEVYTLLRSLGREIGCTVSGHTLAAACLRSSGRLKLFQIDFQEYWSTTPKTLKRYLPYLKQGKFVVITPHHSFAILNSAIIDNQSIDENEVVLCVYEFI